MLARRRAAELALAALAALVSFVPRAALAQACDAGTCPDDDHDGVAACGCPWAGTPCDCDDSDPETYPGAPEACDAPKDENCDGLVGDPCAKRRGCLRSVCVPECIPLDDFGCPPGSWFASQPDGRCLCAPSDCALFGCPPGSTCDESRRCVSSCPPEVRCPRGQRCRGSGCADLCAGIACPSDSACKDGLCVPSCLCASCAAGEACDTSAPVPACVDPACVGISCGAGKHCEKGTCVGDCEGVVCPPMRVCRNVSVNGAPARGECVGLCSPDPCKPGLACSWRDGSCMPKPHADGGLTAPQDTLDALEIAGAGWQCGASGLARAGAFTTAAAAALLAALAARRRRR